MPLYAAGDDLYVLLTKRTDEVEHHKGQISFPGGAREPGDRDLLATALREAEEEVGIARSDVEILGEMDDVETYVSGFVITPFVGVIPYPYPLRPNPREIQELVFVPLITFLDPANMRVEYRDRGGVKVPLYFYQHGEHVIWGATARIVKDFVEAVFSGSEPDE
ncbi:MAG: CoA pyrophosphatase [Armatimonadetes bacterium]|nr:CoA pyrophosphatase [Armatimonadota bacterium]